MNAWARTANTVFHLNCITGELTELGKMAWLRYGNGEDSVLHWNKWPWTKDKWRPKRQATEAMDATDESVTVLALTSRAHVVSSFRFASTDYRQHFTRLDSITDTHFASIPSLCLSFTLLPFHSFTIFYKPFIFWHFFVSSFLPKSQLITNRKMRKPQSVEPKHTPSIPPTSSLFDWK